MAQSENVNSRWTPQRIRKRRTLKRLPAEARVGMKSIQHPLLLRKVTLASNPRNHKLSTGRLNKVVFYPPCQSFEPPFGTTCNIDRDICMKSRQASDVKAITSSERTTDLLRTCDPEICDWLNLVRMDRDIELNLCKHDTAAPEKEFSFGPAPTLHTPHKLLHAQSIHLQTCPTPATWNDLAHAVLLRHRFSIHCRLRCLVRCTRAAMEKVLRPGAVWKQFDLQQCPEPRLVGWRWPALSSTNDNVLNQVKPHVTSE